MMRTVSVERVHLGSASTRNIIKRCSISREITPVEADGGEAERWDPFTRVDLHELCTEWYSMSGTKFTRSDLTDRSNATIIGAELLDLTERGVSERTESIRQDLSRCKTLRGSDCGDRAISRSPMIRGRCIYLRRGVSDRKSLWSGCSSLLANLIYNFTFAFCIATRTWHGSTIVCDRLVFATSGIPLEEKTGRNARDSLWGTTLNLCRDLRTRGADADETTKTMFRWAGVLESFETCLQFILRVRLVLFALDNLTNVFTWMQLVTPADSLAKSTPTRNQLYYALRNGRRLLSYSQTRIRSNIESYVSLNIIRQARFRPILWETFILMV